MYDYDTLMEVYDSIPELRDKVEQVHCDYTGEYHQEQIIQKFNEIRSLIKQLVKYV